VGIYAQAVLAPSETWEFRPGVRFDNHDAPFAPNVHQVSPRLRVSWFPNPANTIWVYYGRLFLPTNVEDLRAITSVAQAGVVTDPTLPERDHFYEVGLVHRFPVGVVTKLSAYHKRSKPGIDDNTVPGTNITTSVNLADAFITGIEAVAEVRPSGPVSGDLNVALNHAYGRGPITGGFFPADTPEGFFDLDHDQRLSVTASLNYAAHGAFLNATGIYGSGLTNGADPDSSYGTALFDFNRSIKVDPSFIVNASAGYALPIHKAVIRGEVFVENVLDRKYLLKGAFFSGASVGKPRTVQVRLKLGT
jgi:outer membrane receptor for ferrienterochelin and colicin